MEEEVELDLLPEEQEALDAAGSLDEQMDSAYADMAPEGDYSKGALNSVVDGLNKLLPMFDVDEQYPKFDSETEVLPPEFVRQLTMVLDAAADSGAEGMDMDLSQVTDDQALRMLAGRLDSLSKDREFKLFLTTDAKSMAQEAPAPAPVEMAPPAGPMPAADMDELLMSRL